MGIGKKNKVDPEQAEEADELPKKEKFGEAFVLLNECVDVDCEI